jgi:hypothetical protein
VVGFRGILTWWFQTACKCTLELRCASVLSLHSHGASLEYGKKDGGLKLWTDRELYPAYNRWRAVRVKLLSLDGDSCWLAGCLEPPNQHPAPHSAIFLDGCANLATAGVRRLAIRVRAVGI